jgi:hypothetical protein
MGLTSFSNLAICSLWVDGSFSCEVDSLGVHEEDECGVSNRQRAVLNRVGVLECYGGI